MTTFFLSALQTEPCSLALLGAGFFVLSSLARRKATTAPGAGKTVVPSGVAGRAAQREEAAL
jgi:hypothetical protein